MRHSLLFPLAFLLCLPLLLHAQSPAKRAIAIEDIYRMQDVTEVHTSPDGEWIAYTVTAADRKTDEFISSVWMVNWKGTQNVRLTHGRNPAYSPQWSPDGKYLAFLSSLGDEGKTQVWLQDRLGGDAFALTDTNDDLSDYR